jgi:hypothetical protein
MGVHPDRLGSLGAVIESIRPPAMPQRATAGRQPPARTAARRAASACRVASSNVSRSLSASVFL